jgi:hypothetical protein
MQTRCRDYSSGVEPLPSARFGEPAAGQTVSASLRGRQPASRCPARPRDGASPRGEGALPPRAGGRDRTRQEVPAGRGTALAAQPPGARAGAEGVQPAPPVRAARGSDRIPQVLPAAGQDAIPVIDHLWPERHYAGSAVRQYADTAGPGDGASPTGPFPPFPLADGVRAVTSP